VALARLALLLGGYLLVHCNILLDGVPATSALRSSASLRPIALGRKNWLFAGGLRADQRVAAIMSLLHTARLTRH
jgi:hypothetical protein